jgi:hypothetical protein
MTDHNMPSYGWFSYLLGLIRLAIVPQSQRQGDIRRLADSAMSSRNPDERLRVLLHCTDWACHFSDSAPDKDSWGAFQDELLSRYHREREAQNR